MLAKLDIFGHLNDHPWPGCQMQVGPVTITWMSSSIATMILVAVGLVAILIPASRKHRRVPSGMGNVLEVLVIFVRDRIARPALHDKAYQFLPLLLTLFVFILGMNLSGLLHIGTIVQGIAGWVPWLRTHPIGVTPTTVLTVCGGLASISFLSLISMGWRAAALRLHDEHKWPWVAAVAAAPVGWFLSLAPPLPGAVRYFMLLPMAVLEFVGALTKTFSLMIRLFANLLAGHAIIATLLLFVALVSKSFVAEMTPEVFYVGPACVLGCVVMSLMELMVAGLQAFIFTFISALMLGLYVEPSH